MENIAILKKMLERERKARQRAEKIIEAKTRELTVANDELKKVNQILAGKIDERSKEIEILSRFPDENPNPILRFDEQAKLLYSNENGKLLFKLLNEHPDSQQQLHQKISEVIAAQEATSIDLKFEEASYSIFIAPIPNKTHVTIYANETTESENARKMADLLRIWMDFSSDAIHVVDENGNYVFLNKVAKERLGYSESEIMNINVLDTEEIFEHKIDKWKAHVESLKRVPTALVEGVNIRKDGSRFPVEVSVKYQQIYNKGYVVAFIRDISERKQNENRLEEQRQFYESILNSIPTDVAVFDNQHRYIFLNPEAVFDQERRDWLIGRDDFEYCKKYNKDPKLAQTRRELFHQSISSKKIVEVEEEIHQPNGDTLIKLRRYKPLLDKNGDIKWVIGYGLDLTSRKMMENQLLRNDRILKGINEASRHLVSEPDYQIAVNKALKEVGLSVEVDRVYIFQNHTDDHGEVYMSQKFEWAKAAVKPQINNPELQKIYYHQQGFARWYEMLSSGKPVNGNTSTFPVLEQEILSPQNIFSILVMPIFIGHKFWGFLGFDDCTSERKWTDAEKNILHNLINTIAGSISRHNSELELLKNKERLESALKGSNDGLFDLDYNSETPYYSPRFIKLLQYDGYEEELPQNLDELKSLIHPKDQQQVRDGVANCLKHGYPFSLEFRLKTKDGNYKWFNGRGDIEKEIHNTPSRFIGFFTDITERKLAQIKLQESEADLKLAQNVAHIGSWHIDVLTRKIRWSSYMYEIFGIPKGEVNYDDVMGMIHKDDMQKWEKNIATAYEKKQSYRFDYRIVRGDGELRYIEANGEVIIENDEVTAMFGTVMDISDRKTTELELAHAKEMAEASMRTKEIFLANMSHEIRTPMNGILGLTGLLEKTPLSLEQKKLFTTLKNTSENLLVIINDILDFAKIDAGKIIFESLPFELDKTVTKTIQSFLFKAEEKELSLHYKLKPLENRIVIGDPYRLGQVINNLMSNAIKFTEPNGKIEFSCKILKEDSKSITIQFSVCDTGIGISRDKQGSLFKAFSQAHSGTFGGTGLGLSICKNLLEKQGGSIWFDSAAGQGSNFHFTISYRKTDQKSVKVEKEQQYDYSSLGTLKVLLAEDNEVNLFIASAMMKDWGFEISHAMNGKEAVDLMKKQNFDLVLMDIQMPVMSGLEATRWIRKMKNDKKARVPIIALTANAIKGDRERYIHSGMNDYMSKPFTESQLFKKISNLVQPRPSTLKKVVQSEPQPVEKKLFSMSQIYEIGRGNQDFVDRMLKLFLNTVPPNTEHCLNKLKIKDYAAISKIVHSMKPTIDTLKIPVRDEIRMIEKYDLHNLDDKQLEEKVKYVCGILNEVKEQIIQELENQKV